MDTNSHNAYKKYYPWEFYRMSEVIFDITPHYNTRVYEDFLQTFERSLVMRKYWTITKNIIELCDCLDRIKNANRNIVNVNNVITDLEIIAKRIQLEQI